MNRISVDGQGPVLIKITRTKPDGTKTFSIEERAIIHGSVSVPDSDTDTIEAQVFGFEWSGALSLPFIFKPPMKMEKEYATEESLNRWGYDGVYSAPENVRRDGWRDELLTRNVTEWRKAEG